LAATFLTGAAALLFCAKAGAFFVGTLDAGEPCLPTAAFATAFALLFADAGLDVVFTKALLRALDFLAATVFLEPVFLVPILPAVLAALFIGLFTVFLLVAFAVFPLVEELSFRTALLRVAEVSALPRALLPRAPFDEVAGFLVFLADCPRCSAEAAAFGLLAVFLIDGIRVTLPYRPALETGQTSRNSLSIPLHRICLAALREHRTARTPD
jgi:hypothetical protein